MTTNWPPPGFDVDDENNAMADSLLGICQARGGGVVVESHCQSRGGVGVVIYGDKTRIMEYRCFSVVGFEFDRLRPLPAMRFLYFVVSLSGSGCRSCGL